MFPSGRELSSTQGKGQVNLKGRILSVYSADFHHDMGDWPAYGKCA